MSDQLPTVWWCETHKASRHWRASANADEFGDEVCAGINPYFAVLHEPCRMVPIVPVPAGLVFGLSLHNFDGGIWAFHAVDNPEDDHWPPTHWAFVNEGWESDD